jgi:hypothetical protein
LVRNHYSLVRFTWNSIYSIRIQSVPFVWTHMYVPGVPPCVVIRVIAKQTAGFSLFSFTVLSATELIWSQIWDSANTCPNFPLVRQAKLSAFAK